MKYSFAPKQNLSRTKLQEMEQFFWDAYADGEKREEVFAELDAFFSKADASTDKLYYYTFFRWYVALLWKKINALPKAKVIAAFERTVPLAIGLGVDVINELLRYLVRWPDTNDDAKELYTACHKAMWNSGSYVGKEKNKEYSLAALVKEMGFNGGVRKTSVERAALYSKMIEIVKLPDEYEWVQYYPAPTERELVEDLVELATFFVENPVDQLDDLLVHFELDILYAGNPDQSGAAGGASSAETTVAPSLSFLDGLLQNINNFAAWSASEAMRESLLTWLGTQGDVGVARMALAKQLQPLLANIHEDIDTAGAVVELDRYLQDHGYPATNEFLYFDDNDAGFHWHESYT